MKLRTERVPRLKRLVSSLVIVALALGLAGCFDANEVENLNVVAGIGVDLVQDSLVQVTLEIFRPSPSGHTSGAGQRGRQSFIVSETGSTIEEAISKLTKRSPRKLYYPHNALFIFGRKYAERGLDKAFDYLERDRAYRRNELLLIASNDASEILQSTFVTPEVTSLGLRQLIDEAGKQSEVYDTEQLTFLRQYLEPSHTSVATVIGLGETMQAMKMPMVTGLGLVKQGKLITVLSDPQLKGLLWSLGETRQTPLTISVSLSSQKGQQNTIRLVRTYRRVQWYKRGQKLVADYTVTGKAEVDHLSGSKSISPKIIQKLETKTDQYVAEQMRASMQTMQKLGVDGAQLATSLHRTKPVWWKHDADSWNDIYPSIETHYHVHIDIIRTGLSGKSPTSTYSTPGSLPPSE